MGEAGVRRFRSGPLAPEVVVAQWEHQIDAVLARRGFAPAVTAEAPAGVSTDEIREFLTGRPRFRIGRRERIPMGERLWATSAEFQRTMYSIRKRMAA